MKVLLIALILLVSCAGTASKHICIETSYAVNGFSRDKFILDGKISYSIDYPNVEVEAEFNHKKSVWKIVVADKNTGKKCQSRYIEFGGHAIGDIDAYTCEKIIKTIEKGLDNELSDMRQ